VYGYDLYPEKRPVIVANTRKFRQNKAYRKN
jgi:hypothetical protein